MTAQELIRDTLRMAGPMSFKEVVLEIEHRKRMRMLDAAPEREELQRAWLELIQDKRIARTDDNVFEFVPDAAIAGPDGRQRVLFE